jgi:hypothetical protein
MIIARNEQNMAISYEATGLRLWTPPVMHRHHPVQPRRVEQQESLPHQLHPRPARRVHGVRESANADVSAAAQCRAALAAATDGADDSCQPGEKLREGVDY